MKLIEMALYKLSLNGTISIEAAKVLYSLYRNRAGSVISLSGDCGLERNEVEFALSELKALKLTEEAGVFYYVPYFEEKLCSLVSGGSVPILQRVLAKV